MASRACIRLTLGSPLMVIPWQPTMQSGHKRMIGNFHLTTSAQKCYIFLEKIDRYSNKIDACIHFAAFAYVGESVNDPTLYVSNNIVQGASLLNSLRGHGINRVVFSSSCTTYGEPEYTPIGEEHPQRPTNFYGWTKLLMEQMLASYSQAYGMSYVALRYFNAAGAIPGHGERHDPETHLIPNVLTAAGGGA